MSKVRFLAVLVIGFALAGCESEHQSYQRRAKSMTPADLESLSREELEWICGEYLSDADAAAAARPYYSYRSTHIAPWSHIAMEVRGLGVPPEPETIHSKCNDLDALVSDFEARLQEARVACGPCFGVGWRGESFAKRYNEAVVKIPEWRETIAQHRARALAIAEQRSRTHAWRRANQDMLTYQDEQVAVEITDIVVVPSRKYLSSQTHLKIKLTALDEKKILRPRNSKIWGYDVHPDLGGFYPIGATCRDNLGNELPLRRFTPAYFGSRGLHAGDTEQFDLVFADYPVTRATSVVLRFDSGIFGQERTIEIVLPMGVFLKSHENAD